MVSFGSLKKQIDENLNLETSERLEVPKIVNFCTCGHGPLFTFSKVRCCDQLKKIPRYGWVLLVGLIGLLYKVNSSNKTQKKIIYIYIYIS